MHERDIDLERAHLRVEGNGVGEEDTDWERAHLRVKENGVEYEDTDWERAHLIERVAWGRVKQTWRDRT